MRAHVTGHERYDGLLLGFQLEELVDNAGEIGFDEVVIVISFQEGERPQLATGKVFDFLIWVLNESVMFLFLFVRMSDDDVFLFFL